MAQPSRGGPFDGPSPDSPFSPRGLYGPTGPGAGWVEVRSQLEVPVNTSPRMDAVSQQPSEEEDQEGWPPSLWGLMGQLPFAFPPPPVLRLSRPEELAQLKMPNDVPVQVLEEIRDREGYKRYVNYPSRLFHLRPQSNLRIPEDLDWEKAFLWQKVSSSQCDAAWIQEFTYPALNLPLHSFPEAILRRGMTMNLSTTSPIEALEFAAAVLKTPGRALSGPAPSLDVPWRDVKKLALHIVEQLKKRGQRGADAMAAKVREHNMAMDDYRSFFRFRDSNRKPTGMGFRGTRDTILLDDEYLTDFLNRASQSGDFFQRKRSDVKLVSFLNSLDAAKVTILAVSASAFRERKARTYLCYAIVRTFPNLEKLILTTIGTTNREMERHWRVTPQQPRFARLQSLVQTEIHQNGGSSYLARPHEDKYVRFDLYNMSRALIEVTGAFAGGRGRITAGEPPRTPLVAYGVGAGLLHDPYMDPDDLSQDPRFRKAMQETDPPLVEAVQDMLSATFKVVIRRKEVAAMATRLEALAKLEGRRTRIPRPVRPAAGSAQPVKRLYRRSEVTPEDVYEWTLKNLAKEKRRQAVWPEALPEDVSSETDPESEDSVPAADTGPSTKEYARVEAFVLIYDRDAFDRNVQSGWTGFAPGVDLSHFRRV